MSDLYQKALGILKEIRPVKKAMADDDGGENREDPRAEGAEPTNDQLEAAGEEAAAGGAPQGGDGGEGGGDGSDGVPTDPSQGAGDGAGDEGQGDDDEHEDLSPEQVRDMAKAFGLTAIDEPTDAAKSTNIVKLLEGILSAIKGQNAYQEELRQDLAELRAAYASGHGQFEGVLRETKKALDEGKALAASVEALQKDLLARVTDLPRTAPAAQSRAITKAMDPTVQTPAAEPDLTSQALFDVALSGKMGALEVAKLNRELHQRRAN